MLAAMAATIPWESLERFGDDQKAREDAEPGMLVYRIAPKSLRVERARGRGRVGKAAGGDLVRRCTFATMKR